MSPSYSSPVSGLYILDEAGIPLFARTYESSEEVGDETILLGGFLTAIELFARSHLQGQITDIGMQTKRYFFLKKKGLIYVVSVKITPEEKYYTKPEVLEAVINILENISLAFEIIYDVAGGKTKDFEEIVNTFGPTADSIIMEATVDLEEIEDMELEETEKILQSSVKGETIDVSNESEEIENILEELKKAIDSLPE